LTSSKRQRELARRRAERQAIRRAEIARKQRRRSITSWSVGLVVLALLIAVPVYRAVTKDDAEAASPDATPTASPSATPDAPAGVACDAEAPAAGEPQKFEKAPKVSINTAKKYTATIKTSCGEVVVELLANNAPTTVNSFNFLASNKYFDGTKCHRMLTEGDFVIQCGDPTASGSGGPGYQFEDENLPKGSGGTYTYPAGTVAMANSGADTNGSQFFFVVKDSPFPPNYTVFGTVSKGMDVLEKLLAVGLAPDTEQPAESIFIESFTVKAS